MNPEADQDYLYFDHDFEPWWRGRRGRWALGICGVLVVVGASLFRPAWSRFQEWQALRRVTEGRAFLAKGELSEAHDRAHAALSLRPKSPAALQLMAEVWGQAGASVALDYWRELAELSGATDEHRRGWAEAALARERTDLAEVPLRQLLAVRPVLPSTLLLAVRHHLLLDQIDVALRHARELEIQEGADGAELAKLSEMLAERPEVECRAESAAVLWRMAQGGRERRLPALERLIQGGKAEARDLERAESLLAALPGRSVEENVLLAEARMGRNEARARDIALEALKSLKAETDDEYLAVLRWLHRQGLYGRAVEFLPAERALSSRALFLIRLEGLIGIGQTGPAYREALRQRSGFQPLDLELDRYYLATVCKDEPAAEAHQIRIFGLANKETARLRRVAEFAEARKLMPLAISAWKAVAGDRLETRRALRSLSGLADSVGDTWAAREYDRQLAKLEPTDERLRLRIAHFDALLGENLAEALSVADGLMEHASAGRHARFVAALANLRLGRLEEARRCFARLPGQGQVHAPEWEVIRTAVLAAGGQAGEASLGMRKIRDAQLRPEERELVRPFLGGAGARSDR